MAARAIRTSITSFFLLSLFLPALPAYAGSGLEPYESLLRQLMDKGLKANTAYKLLSELALRAPHRLSGSPGAEAAVNLTLRMMDSLGFQQVHAETVMVPRWVRGRRESAVIVQGVKGVPRSLAVCALGGSIATAPAGITAEVIEVRSFEELARAGDAVKGKIVFFNRPMDPSKFSTFEAYGGAVDQRSRGAVKAAEAGGVAALVRSVTLAHDRAPHVGAMGYRNGVRKVPAAAVSTNDADTLSELLRRNPRLKMNLVLECQTYPDVPSANAVGQITGSEKPHEIIVVGGHLDSWDKGHGAHDDGAGCMQAIEALRLLKEIGVRPKRTIRAVMFMNEENGTRGGKGYPVAPQRSGERHVAAIESDRGGFAPHGFTVQGDSTLLRYVQQWQPLFARLGAERIRSGSGGVDIGPLAATGVPAFGLDVDDYRYFDYHHSDNDTVDKVHPRELELGAIIEALLCYLISEEGLPTATVYDTHHD